MNPEEQINALKQALRDVVKAITDRGEPLSDQLKEMLAQVFQHVEKRILELREQEQTISTPSGPSPTEPLTPGPFPSSNINSFKYDPKNNRLLVKFQGEYPQQNGPVYSYDKVPPFIFDVFRRGAVAPKTSGKNAWHSWKKNVTPSLGAAMHALVKLGGYPYQRVS